MPLRSVPVALPGRSYEILIGHHLLQQAPPPALAKLVAGRRCLLVSDSVVAPLYGNAAEALLRAAGAREVKQAVFAAGEASKHLGTLGQLYEAALRAKLDRSSLIVGLGGGVVTDISGFLAATWMRGVDYLQIPTTLLAQVDSAIGGKTGVDLPGGKNLVGAFHQPSQVLVDLATLQSLPARQLQCGLAEVIKYGLIMDAAFFDRLEALGKDLLTVTAESYAPLVQRCCELKAMVVCEDEKDLSGRRAILNYGHTFGHAIETLGNYTRHTHGEAITIGMAMAAETGLLLEATPARQLLAQRQQALFEAVGLPTTVTDMSVSDILTAMQADKKFVNGRSRLILPFSIGDCRQVADVPEELVRQAIASRCRE